MTGDNEFDPNWDSPVIDGSGFFPGVTVSETDPPGTLMETFSAQDNDTGTDGEIEFDLVSITTGWWNVNCI